MREKKHGEKCVYKYINNIQFINVNVMQIINHFKNKKINR